MIRVIRAATLRALRAELDQADKYGDECAAEADRWYDRYVEESGRADQVADQAAELRAALDQVRAELAAARDELRGLLDELRAAVADPATGTEAQSRIALALMRRMLAQDIARGNRDPFTRTLAVLIGAPVDEQTGWTGADYDSYEALVLAGHPSPVEAVTAARTARPAAVRGNQ